MQHRSVQQKQNLLSHPCQEWHQAAGGTLKVLPAPKTSHCFFKPPISSQLCTQCAGCCTPFSAGHTRPQCWTTSLVSPVHLAPRCCSAWQALGREHLAFRALCTIRWHQLFQDWPGFPFSPTSTSTTTTSTGRRRSLCAAGRTAHGSRSLSRPSTCWWCTCEGTRERSHTSARWAGRGHLTWQWDTRLGWSQKCNCRHGHGFR